MVTIDGDEIVSGSTIDGDEISQITMDGDVVWEAIDLPDSVVARYDATELELNDGERVDVWPDEYGNFDLEDRSQDPRYRDSGINGNPSVEYGQTANDRNGYDGAAINLDPPYSLVWVAEITGTRDDDDISFFAEDGNDNYNLRIDDGNDNGFNPRMNGDSLGAPFNHDAVQQYLMVLVHYSNGDDFVRMNGTQESYSFPDVSVPNDYGLGGEGSSDRGMEGYIGEFLLYDDALSSNEIADEEDRLADKWGV